MALVRSSGRPMVWLCFLTCAVLCTPSASSEVQNMMLKELKSVVTLLNELVCEVQDIKKTFQDNRDTASTSGSRTCADKAKLESKTNSGKHAAVEGSIIKGKSTGPGSSHLQSLKQSKSLDVSGTQISKTESPPLTTMSTIALGGTTKEPIERSPDPKIVKTTQTTKKIRPSLTTTEKPSHESSKKTLRKFVIVSNNVTSENLIQCFLHRQENISLPVSGNIQIKLPVKVKPGMKVTILGGRSKYPSLQLSVPKDPLHPSVSLSWFNIRAEFDKRRISFVEGFAKSIYQGHFPVADPDYFSLTVELTASSTNYYANKVLVKTRKPIPWLNQLNLRMYGRVDLVVVLKTDKGCPDIQRKLFTELEEEHKGKTKRKHPSRTTDSSSTTDPSRTTDSSRTAAPPEEPWCILFKTKNIKHPVDDTGVFALPMKVKPGMKVTLCGGRANNLSSVEIALDKPPLLLWFKLPFHHIMVMGRRSLFHYKGTFPITNPENFTVTVELSSSSTKCYVNKALIVTEAAVPSLDKIGIRSYNIHSLVIEKTAETCVAEKVSVEPNRSEKKNGIMPVPRGPDRKSVTMSRGFVKKKTVVPVSKGPEKKNVVLVPKRPKKEIVVLPNNSAPKNKLSHCIIYKQENIALSDAGSKHLELPFEMKSGMKVTVYGGTNESLAQLTLTTDPERPTNMFAWFHMDVYFQDNVVGFTDGMKRTYKDRSQQIDPHRFSLSIELTSSVTKIYANNILMKTLRHIPFIKDLNLRKFGRVDLLDVRNTSRECAVKLNVDPSRSEENAIMPVPVGPIKKNVTIPRESVKKKTVMPTEKKNVVTPVPESPPKKRVVMSNSSTPQNKLSHCIIYKQENISLPDSGSKLVTLPVKVVQGMKVTVYGGRSSIFPYSQVTITKTPKSPDNILAWFHIRPEFTHGRLAFTDGFRTYYYDGGFPVSNPNRFTITAEITSSSTKIFVNKVLVKTIRPIRFIADMNFRKFGRVDCVVVQKTSSECNTVEGCWS